MRTPFRLSFGLALLCATLGCAPAARVAIAPYYDPAKLSPSALMRLDVPYRTDEAADPSKHRLDLFLPASEDWPLLVFVHGGSLEKGDTALTLGGHDIYRNIGRFYASHGVGVALVNYRLQPGVTWPGQVDDVATAIAWLTRQVGDLGGDGRIFLSGHSAGSWLVSHVAVDDELRRRHGLEADDITGVISISGSGFDLTDELTWKMFGREKKWQRRFTDRPGDPLWKERASVIPLLDDNDPPFVLLYSSREYKSLVRQNELMCAALRSAGAGCTLEKIKGYGHRRMVLLVSSPDRPVAEGMLRVLGVPPG